MAITQAEAIASVRSRLNEPTSVYWTDEDLRRWINEIASDMARRTESLRAQYLQPAVVGTGEYTPAFTSTTNVYRIHMVEFIPDGQSQVYPMTYMDMTSASSVMGLQQQTLQGIPSIWTTWGTPPTLTLQVFPVPAQDGDLKIWYYRLATQLATSSSADANDNVDIVEGWEDVLVDGVTYKAQLCDGDSSWTTSKQEYEEHLAAEMESTLRFTDQAGLITTPSGSFIPWWLYGGDDFY